MAGAAPPAAPTAADAPAILAGDALDGLGADDPHAVDRAIAAIAARPAADPELLFAAGRACEDKLHDPARALGLYQRVVADHPAARAASAAARRIELIAPLVGPHGETAGLAGELARLIAGADRLPAAALIASADRLATATAPDGNGWAGAPDAALWLADWLRRAGRLADAEARYAAVIARWPDSAQARAALRAAAGCALDDHDWARAAALAARLPDAEQDVRDELLGVARRGRARDRLAIAAWLAIAGAVIGLAGSLAAALRRRPRAARRAALRPPLEVVFLAPVAAVLIGVALTAHRAIAPAVSLISLGGLGFTWLSGATLELLRQDDRPRRLRIAGHIVACVAGVTGLVYLAVNQGDLIGLLIENVRP